MNSLAYIKYMDAGTIHQWAILCRAMCENSGDGEGKDVKETCSKVQEGSLMACSDV